MEYKLIKDSIGFSNFVINQIFVTRNVYFIKVERIEQDKIQANSEKKRVKVIS